MIRFDCAQGSPEWHRARAGVVTASGFDKIMTPGGKPSKQSGAYLNRLVAETILGRSLDDDTATIWTERGLAMEGDAVLWYEADQGVDCEVVGFCLRDDRRLGCSPDRLVGDDGGLEMKNPAIQTHVGYLLKPETLVADYNVQVQINLWVTGRKWWHLLSYNPELPPVLLEVHPDLEWRTAAESALAGFLESMDKSLAYVRGLMGAEAMENPFR